MNAVANVYVQAHQFLPVLCANLSVSELRFQDVEYQCTIQYCDSSPELVFLYFK